MEYLGANGICAWSGNYYALRLMERLGLDVQSSFEYLVRASQRSNRKLAEVAAEFVETRKLPLAERNRPSAP